MSRALRLAVLVAAAAGLTACSTPTAPAAKKCTPSKDSSCANTTGYINPLITGYINPLI